MANTPTGPTADLNLKFTLFGHIAVSQGHRQAVTVTRPDGTQRTTYYHYYHSLVQCENGDSMPVSVRVYSPPGDVTFPDETMMYIIARTCLATTNGSPPLLDIVRHWPLPGTPPSDSDVDNSSYYDGLPIGLSYQCVDIIGVVIDTCKPFDEGANAVDTSLPQATARAFSVQVAEYVASVRRVTTIQCVLERYQSRWGNTPLPGINSIVAVCGVCRHVNSNGILGIAVELLTLNVGPRNAAPGHGPGALPPPPPSGSPSRPFGSRAPARNTMPPRGSTESCAPTAGPSAAANTQNRAQVGSQNNTDDYLPTASEGPSSTALLTPSKIPLSSQSIILTDSITSPSISSVSSLSSSDSQTSSTIDDNSTFDDIIGAGSPTPSGPPNKRKRDLKGKSKVTTSE